MSATPDPSAGIPDTRIRALARRWAGVALVVVLAALAVGVFATAIAPHGSGSVIAPASPSVAPVQGAAASAGVYVHVLGEVAEPGLYLLREGDRTVDAIAAAGGLTELADPGGLNLARRLADGEQLRVPAVGEVPPAAAGGSALVNINTADPAALESLPRIGPALARRIIAWREANGGFSSVEDLLAVSGIGNAVLAEIRSLVTV